MRSHEIDFKAAKTNRVVRLTFNELPAPGKQRRLQGRVVLMPDIDLDKFKARAVIDWLDIQFTSGKDTQARWVFEAASRVFGEACFAEPLDGLTGHRFRMRFQEPDMAIVQKAIDAIRADMGIEGEVEVREMEVSVDFTPVIPDDAERMLLVAVLARHFLPGRDIISSRDDWPRFTWGEESVQTKGVFAKVRTAVES